ncbi:hypothetical protein [Thiomonas sp.]|jgi:hypothetical protein|uniref:hypothetical protein n=1 Tax=Thiomonas sp. TaxID=2047785 RepID=UPI0026126E7D|nr:hypothetical protein [Thiomonas sp.]
MMVQWIAALVMLPLLPLSLAVNAVLQALPAAVRAALLLVLPLGGAALLASLPPPSATVAQALQGLALLTALLYGWRLLAVRELFIWARLQATSAWPLVWLAWLHGVGGGWLLAVATALALPAAVLTVLGCALRQRTGGAYLGLRGRLGAAFPRLGAALAVAVLAALAAPPFPGFFAVLGLLALLPPPAAVAVLALWLLWSWAAARLWQLALYGPAWPRPAGRSDLGAAAAAGWVALAAAAVALALIGSWTWSMR